MSRWIAVALVAVVLVVALLFIVRPGAEDVASGDPETAAQIYMTTGKIPTLQELTDRFQFKVPGEIDVLLRIMESDPRVPRFFERDPATGEITQIHVDRIASEERFRRPLQN